MKIFYKAVNTSNREEMVRFLEGHFRYHTANGWNRSTSYAQDMKVHHLELDREVAEKLWNMVDCEEFYDELNELIYMFGVSHDWKWQAGWNERSGGYLVLYEGGRKETGYRSYCIACGQKNWSSVTETGCRCGRCGKESRVDFQVPHRASFTYPGRSVDQDEDFEFWSKEQIKERVQLVQEFDKLCDQIAAKAVEMTEEYEVVEGGFFIPQTRKILKAQ